MSPSPESLRLDAEEAARRGGRVLAQRFALPRTVAFKGERTNDLVTDADAASEAAVLDYLRGRYPEHSVLAEESGLTSGGELRWLVDPLDGTTNYAHGVPMFSVSVAVRGPEGLLAGAVYEPIRDELFSADALGPATLNGKVLRVAQEARLSRALLCTGYPVDSRRRPLALALHNELQGASQGMLRLGSAAVDLCYVAAGRIDAYFHLGLNPWDVGAGILLVERAGGRVTDLRGAPYDWAQGDVLASSSALHPELVAAARSICDRG